MAEDIANLTLEASIFLGVSGPCYFPMYSGLTPHHTIHYQKLRVLSSLKSCQMCWDSFLLIAMLIEVFSEAGRRGIKGAKNRYRRGSMVYRELGRMKVLSGYSVLPVCR